MFVEGEIYTWQEVSQLHRVRNGVYQRHERLISLLTDFGRHNPCYPDRLDATRQTIRYTGNGRRGDQLLTPSNRALLAAIETGHAVPLFCKLAVGRWEYLGQWCVTDGEYEFSDSEQRMLWRFTLSKALTPR